MLREIAILFVVLSVSSTVAFQPGLPKHFKTSTHGKASVLYMSKDSVNLDEIESLGHEASQNWDRASTNFLNKHDSSLVKDRLEGLADIRFIQIGAMFPDATRTRFVMTNPDLELDSKEIEAEMCTILRIDIQRSDMPKAGTGSNAWPSLLMRIGVDLHNVGDVIVEDDAVYLIVAPEVVKQCKRLLPKELTGVGITVSELEYGEYIPDGVLQEMELGKLDKRALKYG